MDNTGWRIRTIETELLYRKIKWDLYLQVNVLAGANSSGKTLLLKKIYNNLIKLRNGEVPDSDFWISFEGSGPVPNVIYMNTSSDIPLSRIDELVSQCFKVDNDTTVLDLLLMRELDKHKELYNYIANDSLLKHINHFKSFTDTEVFCYIDNIDDDTYNTVRTFSTGEKQLLYILLSVLNTKEEPTVLLMDMIDSSLHFEWQQNLLDSLVGISPNIQIILTTHSPSMIIRGWQSAVKEINDITTI